MGNKLQSIYRPQKLFLLDLPDHLQHLILMMYLGCFELGDYHNRPVKYALVCKKWRNICSSRLNINRNIRLHPIPATISTRTKAIKLSIYSSDDLQYLSLFPSLLDGQSTLYLKAFPIKESIDLRCLKSLYLSRKKDIQEEAYESILNHCPNLKKLTIEIDSKISIIHHPIMKQLEVLSILMDGTLREGMNYNEIVTLDNLKSLSCILWGHENFSDTLKFHASNLEILDLHTNNSSSFKDLSIMQSLRALTIGLKHDEMFDTTSNNMRYLQEIKVNFAHDSSINILEMILDHCKYLHKISTNSRFHMSMFKKCHYLQQLRLVPCEDEISGSREDIIDLFYSCQYLEGVFFDGILSDSLKGLSKTLETLFPMRNVWISDSEFISSLNIGAPIFPE